MRIDELQLLAFGPFTNTVIRFHKGKEGLHLVYGPNEAGKSSALRGIHGLLYGISERSPDNFIHHYTKLRIGGRLRNKDGEELVLVRRKGRGNTLRMEDDATVLDESRLARFLGGIDEALFASMFGIDNETLVRGGKEIIAGGGDLGQLIFSAGSGIVNLKQLRESLRSEAEALFKPAGQKPRINASLSQLNQLRIELRDAQVSGQKWMTHHDNLSGAEKRRSVVALELKSHQVAIHRLRRFQEALPVIARRNELHESFQLCRTAVILPEDFPERRRDLVSRLEVSTHKMKQSQETIARLEKEIAGLEIPDYLVAQSKLIEELQQEVGSQRKALKDRGDLIVNQSTCRHEAGEILKGFRGDLTLAEAGKLRIRKEEAVRIHDLGTEYERIVTRINDARKELPELEIGIGQAREGLKDLGMPADTGLLQETLSGAMEYGPLEKSNHSELDAIRAATESIAREQDGLGLGDRTTEQVVVLRIPSVETIHYFEERFSRVASDISEKEKELGKARRVLKETEKKLGIIRATHDVPAREDLVRTRAARDRGWQLILKDWRSGPAPQAEISAFLKTVHGSGPLHETFEYLLREADNISDRLGNEADRVVENARLAADKVACTKDIEELTGGLKALHQDMVQLRREWEETWPKTGFPVKTPKEMERWVRNFEKWMERTRECNERSRKANHLKHEIEMHRVRLHRELQSYSKTRDLSDAPLLVLIRHARGIVEAQRELSAKREQLSRDIQRKENALKAAEYRLAENESKLREWEGLWAEAVRPIGLSGNSRPSEAKAVMEALQGLFSKLKEAEVLEKRIQGIDRDADEFARKMRALTDTLALDLSDRTPAEAAVELNQRLLRARRAQSIRESMEKQLEQEKQRIEETGEESAAVASDLKRMCEDANCADYSELPEAEKESAARSRIEQEMANVDEQLRKLSGGMRIDDFMLEATRMDPDAIAGEIDALESAIESLDSEKQELDQTIGAERTRLGEMDGSARGAELAERIQVHLGTLENDVEQYARLRIEAFVLNKAIERYREKSEGPILKRASELFRQITGGSFDGIRAEFEPSGQPVVVGVRRDNEIVTVEGMSDGTADQLYLSLRLAGLAVYLEKRETMPFIVDDIFIKFDDDRAAASLQALAEISKITQVICFTHNRHLVDLADRTLDASLLFNYSL